MLASRNQAGLTDYEVARCIEAWTALGGLEVCGLDVSVAGAPASRTEFHEASGCVRLGADAYPARLAAVGDPARCRMSLLACLAHELAHAKRHRDGFRRPYAMPDYLLDEAETSIHASFEVILSGPDRQDLIEDARDQLDEWLRLERERLP